MSKLHPARILPFRDLVDALQAARAERLVYEQVGPGGLRLYCYTNSCVYNEQWNDATLIARGLVLDVDNQTVVATPFPKFFNASERGENIPDLPFETFEKADGSLIIMFWHAGEWRTATKGAFGSSPGGLGSRAAEGLRSFGAEARHDLPGRGCLRGEPHQVIFCSVRPTANELPGYVPSYAVHRLQEESS